jgi:hypothetical protein
VNSLVKPLFRLSKGLGDAALQVSSASGRVAASSQSLAKGASEQAASIEETSSSLEEIASMTKQNAGNASQTNSLAMETKTTTDSCSGTMQEMAGAIGHVRESAHETQKIVKVTVHGDEAPHDKVSPKCLRSAGISGLGAGPFVVRPSGHWGCFCASVNPSNASRGHYEPSRHAWHPANKEPREQLRIRFIFVPCLLS